MRRREPTNFRLGCRRRARLATGKPRRPYSGIGMPGQADPQGRVDAATARMGATGLQIEAMKSVGDGLGLLN